jgi:hypothetical protein
VAWSTPERYLSQWTRQIFQMTLRSMKNDRRVRGTDKEVAPPLNEALRLDLHLAHTFKNASYLGRKDVAVGNLFPDTSGKLRP